MADEKPTAQWIGASGKSYKYWVHKRHPNISADQLGNYIYAKVNAQKNEWVPVYIGQGDLSVRCTKAHHQIDCINSKGATHVHMHTNAQEKDRLAEEQDLLASHPQAYSPAGCNQKKGG